MSQSWLSEDERKVFAFVNFAHPSHMRDQARRTIVQSHVGKYHRNRSKPSQRKQKSEGSEASSQETKVKNHFIPFDDTRITLQNQRSHEDISYGRPEPAQPRDRSTPSNISSTYRSQDVKGIVKFSTRKPQSGRQIICGEQRYSSIIKGQTFKWMEMLYRDATSDLTAYLDQGRRDPFAQYPVDRFASYFPTLVDHAVQIFWSCLSPDRRYGVFNPVNNVYLAHMASSQLACYTYTLVISTNIDYLCCKESSMSIYCALRAEHLCAATKLVREAMQLMPEEPGPDFVSDELIGSILALASCHQIKVVSRSSHPTSRFHSPLATFQSIDMWGAMPFLQAHRMAIVQLVRLRSGLLKLGSSHLAGVVQLNDLVDASRNSCKPLLEWENILEPLPAITWPVESDKHSLETGGTLCAFVDLLAKIALPYCLQSAVAAIFHTTELLRIYIKDDQPDSSIVTLVESRNRAQHLTLSLPSVLDTLQVLEGHDDLQEHDTCTTPLVARAFFSDCIYEIVRLSLLIYNNMVVYPMPPISGVQVRLTKSLRVALNCLLRMDSSMAVYHSSWLVWSITLGGISSESNEDQDWYRDFFCLLLEANPELHEWQSLSDLLFTFLWSEYVLDHEAFAFWLECTSATD